VDGPVPQKRLHGVPAAPAPPPPRVAGPVFARVAKCGRVGGSAAVVGGSWKTFCDLCAQLKRMMPDDSSLAAMMRKTFDGRKAWIKNSGKKLTIQEILVQVPHLSVGVHVSL
jgi:hypothetical protein